MRRAIFDSEVQWRFVARDKIQYRFMSAVTSSGRQSA
jgi:hypothetical protein